ncbi:unnamed protein product [Notodromas monacha]|uniref:F-box domain-containing protein n=1 Tax=Notodromas monacha TaxID=399045 RepID=A0A7R9BIQ9_9CRUS|nr:unnamed protein product [Notodromas monacha]CAG0914682.1 unnamed protein product [Notodromas monacha]
MDHRLDITLRTSTGHMSTFICFAMSAYLMRLDFGFRNLSYIELERSGSITHLASSEDWMKNPKKPTAEFYIRWLQNEPIVDSARIPLHVHKVENGMKVGGPCPFQFGLEKLFSVGEDPDGDFALTVDRIRLLHFQAEVLINSKSRGRDGDVHIFKLRHGDIIECVRRGFPCYRIMFLLADAFPANEPKTSFLQSCPQRVLKNITKFLSPLETLKSVIPVCRRFFELVGQDGGNWAHLEFRVEDSDTYVPFWHLEEFLGVFARHAEKLSLELRDPDQNSKDVLHDFIRLFGRADWKKLRSLEIHSLRLDDATMMKFLRHLRDCAQLQTLAIYCCEFGTALLLLAAAYAGDVVFPNVEQLTLQCLLRAISSVDAKLVFPRLMNSLWLECVNSKAAALDYLRKMTSLEMLWIRFRHYYSKDEHEKRRALFSKSDESSKEWLDNLKFISPDLWESSIQYSKMAKLECVAFQFKFPEDVDHIEQIFHELRACEKLRGLILCISSDDQWKVIRNRIYYQSAGVIIEQQLEFAAVSGSDFESITYILPFIFEETMPRELWIQVRQLKDLNSTLIQMSDRWQNLDKAVFVMRTATSEGGKQLVKLFPEALRKHLFLKCSLTQATLLFRKNNGYNLFTYSMEQQQEVPFTSSAFLRFFSEWLEYVPSRQQIYKLGDFDFLEAIFPG